MTINEHLIENRKKILNWWIITSDVIHGLFL